MYPEDAPPDKKPWTMPAWMEPYRDLIGNTGGNPVEELVNDSTASVRNNVIRAALCVAVESQVALLHRLHERGWLVVPDGDRGRCTSITAKGYQCNYRALPGLPRCLSHQKQYERRRPQVRVVPTGGLPENVALMVPKRLPGETDRELAARSVKLELAPERDHP